MPERLSVMRPLSFSRKPGEAPDPKILRARERQRQGNAALAAVFSALDEDGDGVISVAEIAKALKSGANVNFPLNDLGETALHIAVAEHDIALASELLRRGANTRARDRDGLTPLLRALREGKDDMSSLLARAEEKPERQVSGGRHAIHDAAAHNHVGALEALIARGTSPTLRDTNGTSPLIEALRNESVEAALALAYTGGAEKGMKGAYRSDPVDPARGYDGPLCRLTELFEAAAGTKPPVVRPVAATPPQKLPAREEKLFSLIDARDYEAALLHLSRHPDLAARNDAGDTPLIAALRNGLYGVAEKIADKSDLKAAGQYGQTALHVAAAASTYRSVDVLRQLLRLGAPINAKDNRGWSPLMQAAHMGCDSAMRALLEKGAKTDITDNLGFTAEEHARFADSAPALGVLGEYATARKPATVAAKNSFTAAARTSPKKPLPSAAKAAPGRPVSGRKPSPLAKQKNAHRY